MSRTSGHGAQVVNVTVDHKYVLDDIELERILMREQVKDLPVVLVSVAGAYRGGKSFLLNFFLRYLTSAPASREDGSWLSEDSEVLIGFSWRGGSKKDTTGILMWSEPFITTLPSGEEVAVLLMDTQGAFDSTSTVRDCSTIFALSTLLSSVQIYNLSQNIQEDHLQYLQLFTEYGRLIKDQKSGKPFQVLKFLVRDWSYPWEYPYGSVGGDMFLEERLKENPETDEELRELRKHIRSCFDEVSCFLMPHPDFKVLKPDFKGNISEISRDFRTHLVQLVSSIFGPEKLQPKLVNGETVKARELFKYFKTYMSLFNSNKIPSPTSIMKATAEVALQTALREGLAQYVANMDSACGEKSLCVPAVDVKELHKQYKDLVLSHFHSKMMMGSEKEVKRYFEMLLKDIDNQLQHYSTINMVKQQKLTEVAKSFYDNEISTISVGEQFCMHPETLKTVHTEAFDAALKVFDDAQKRVTDKIDNAREKFKTSLESQYDLLKLNNDINNKRVIAELGIKYWQYMESKTSTEAILSKAELQKEHDIGLAKALEDFKRTRVDHVSYSEDIYRADLIQFITSRYMQIKAINGSVTEKAIMTAVSVYNQHITSAWDQRNQSLHPDDLAEEHKTAKRKAFVSFRPNKEPSAGFDTSDEDEKNLENILALRHQELDDVNVAANKAAVQTAIKVYREDLDERESPTWTWFLVVPAIVSATQTANLTHHEESKKVAIKEFYRRRRNKGREDTDIYLQHLVSTLDSINNCKRLRQYVKDLL